jgi:hypothetical protein
MIENDDQLETTMQRLARFQQQIMRVRQTTSPENYEASAGGFLAEIDRMMLEVRDYLWQPPALKKRDTVAA